ncbi:unnamed protein product, partial [Ectocarpus sp. 4 AP-2014]
MFFLFRYIYKGPEWTSFAITEVAEDTVDTIKQWKSLRCLSATEAAWRTIIHDMHFRQPAAEGKIPMCSSSHALFISPHNFFEKFPSFILGDDAVNRYYTNLSPQISNFLFFSTY